jgi:hypothetical protein
MLASMTRHDWALVCPPGDGNQEWDAAMPNKFFESMLCGVPVLTFGCPEVEEAVRASGFLLGRTFKNCAALLEWAASPIYGAPSSSMRRACTAWAREKGLMQNYLPTLREGYAKARALAAKRSAGIRLASRVNG